jgi:Tol biopolymer transport system component
VIRKLLLLTLLALTLATPLAAVQADVGARESLPAPVTARPLRIADLAVPLQPTLAISPDGRFFAAVQSRPDPILWIIPADGGEPFSYRRMWAAYKPRWSPSGKRIGFIAGIGPPRIWTVEVDPATARPIDPPRLLIRTAANAFAFSPDGERVALIASHSTAAGVSEIRIVTWETRAERILLRENGLIYRVDWSPDGQFLYYGVSPTGFGAEPANFIVRCRVVTGKPTTVRRVGEFLGLSPDGQYLLFRPTDNEGAAGSRLLMATVDGDTPVEIEVPGGAQAAWGASSSSLVQISYGDSGDTIWRLDLRLP